MKGAPMSWQIVIIIVSILLGYVAVQINAMSKIDKVILNECRLCPLVNIRLSDKAQRDIETEFHCVQRGMEILDLIVAEWTTDPTSVQCFDLRIVEEAKAIMAQYKKVKPAWR